MADTSEAEWDAVVRVHLKGHFATVRHAAQYWCGQAQLGAAVDARIINTSSAAGLQGSVAQANYSAAKAGIAALTLVAAAELRRYGITGKVFEVEGGLIRVAEGWAHGPQIDKGARWDPAELGAAVADLLAKSRPPIPVYLA